MSIPDRSQYPDQYDTDYELKTTVDGLSSTVVSVIVPLDPNDSSTYDWENGEGIINLDDASAWPDSGYVTVYLADNFDIASRRAILFHYSSKSGNDLVGVTICPGQTLRYFPENSLAIQNVVAENHNYSKDAILSLESYLGCRGTSDQSTIEWFTNFYCINVKVPKPWMHVDATSVFVGDYVTITDMTTRIKPGFTGNLDSTVSWIFQMGDGTKIEVSLDSENSLYVFETSQINDNGLMTARIEKKSSWNRQIKYRYKVEGIFTLSLSVKNEFGTDNLEFKDCMMVVDQAPKSLTLNVKGKNVDGNANSLVRCKSVVDSVEVNSSVKFFNNAPMQISQYVWDIPGINKDLLLSSPYLNLYFSVGGMYSIGLRVVTTTHSWIASFLNDAVDVVEKPSVWLGYVATNSGDFSLHEYSIRANSWKSNPVKYSLNYSFADISNNETTFVDSKGIHSPINSDDAYLFWAPSQKELNIAKYNSMSNSFAEELDMPIIKFYDWYTLYIPVFDANKIFVLGGLSDLADQSTMNQDIMFYDVSTKTFSTVVQDYVFPTTPDAGLNSYTTAYQNAQSMIENPKSKPPIWKICTYEDKGYMLRSSVNDLIENFFSFDPTSSTFSVVNSLVPFTKHEIGFDALNDGLYAISGAGDLFKYSPKTNVWISTSSRSVNSFVQAFSSLNGDENAKVVTGSTSRTIDANNTDLYFSFDKSLDTFGKFDASTLTFSQLAMRPSYGDGNGSFTEQWDMTVF